MPRVTTNGRVTIPQEIRTALDLDPGDEIAFEEVDSEYVIRKQSSTTVARDVSFATHRGSADRDDSMAERMRRLRGQYPRSVADDEADT